MDPRDEATELLIEAGATVARQKKHEVWKLPDGRIWTRSKTPSDSHSDQNNLSDLKKMLGIRDGGRSNPDRVKKKPAHGGAGKAREWPSVGSNPLADQLRMSGAVEQKLREEMEMVKDRIVTIEAELLHERAERQACWCCRLRAWWKKQVAAWVAR
jgi:hypothetical protein